MACETYLTVLLVLVIVCLSLPAQGSRVLLQSSPSNATANATFECGKPMGPCGTAIPAGETCEKVPGFCQPGYFFGWEENTGQPSKCLPVPAKCGTAGKPCCPSNTKEPHTSNDEKLKRQPYCSDGSTCFFFRTMAGMDNGDIYAGNKGAQDCTAIATNCGTGPGTPCCPLPYKLASNPTLQRGGCGNEANAFCNYDEAQNSQNSTAFRLPTGTCAQNTPDCGQFGKMCCIFTAGSSTGMQCGPQFGQSGPKGYCANPAGYKGSAQAPLKDLVCTKCPDIVDPSLEKTNPSMYFNCRP